MGGVTYNHVRPMNEIHEYKGSRLAMIALIQAEYKRSMCTADANFLQKINIILFSLSLMISC
jgi:hypothetical protein